MKKTLFVSTMALMLGMTAKAQEKKEAKHEAKEAKH